MSTGISGAPRDERLEELGREVEEVKSSVEEALESLPQAVEEVTSRPAVDPSIQKRLREQGERLKSMKPAFEEVELDVEQTNTMLSAIIDVDRAVGSDEPDLDRFEVILLGIEQIRQVVRDALDEFSGASSTGQSTLVKGIEQALPGVTQKSIARLVGVDTRTLRRWTKGGDGQPSERLRLVARLVAILRHAWSPAGVVAWFDRPRPALGEKAPIDLLDDPSSERVLVSEARAGRNQYAT